MTFRIERLIGAENAIVLRVSGRVHNECMQTLKELIETEACQVALDLAEVTLVNRDAAAFLAVYESKGVVLINCPAYLRGLIGKAQPRIGP